MIKMKWVLLLIVFMVAGCSSGVNESPEKHSDKPLVNEENRNEEKPKESERNEAEKEEEKETMSPITEPKYEVNEASWKLDPIGNANEKVVLLTIDDAPDQYAVQMAETLRELGANAIFFVNGHFLDTNEGEQALKKIHELGFLIGNHTYNHKNLTEISAEEQREEIVHLNNRIEEIIGERPKFFRAPFGANTDESLEIAKDEEMIAMNWTYGYDWEKEYQSKAELTKIMVDTPYLSEGAILLMHDRQWTNDALVDIVKGLKDKGYEMADPNTIKTY
ncbi:polysaccharide deacetylase family protein [Cytobacillus horneckiae]|uniref:polysaccharide deacetylase family protein n=1 Tax=Cytobacillus horneckiae TaxID=549687 RepID=UPI0034CDA60B